MSIVTEEEDLLGSLIADGTVARPSAPAPGNLVESALRPAHAADDELGDPRAPQAHREARHHLVRRRASRARGLPASRRSRRADRAVLREQGQTALQYATTEGYLPLRELLVRHMARYGIKVSPQNVMITSGSQQALDLIGKLLINPGDRVLTESPTYLGALQAFSAYQADYLPVPSTTTGSTSSGSRRSCAAGRSSCTSCPNFQNPAGVTLSLERRRRLVELATHYGMPIVEDDPYGQLRYEGEHLPPLVEIDAELHGCEKRRQRLHGQRALPLDALQDARARACASRGSWRPSR